MKIVHGITLLAVLVLIGSIFANLNGDLIKWLIVVVWVGFGIELIKWSDGIGNHEAVVNVEPAQTTSNADTL
jgi:hypothetical protein